MFLMADTMAGIAAAVSSALGGPYNPATLSAPGEAVFDAGGSIANFGEPDTRDCQVQVDAATEAMRSADGFQDTDVRLMILTASLTGPVDTTMRLTVTDGPRAGTYAILSVSRDPMGVLWDCRGRCA